jgi:hypothetical protein
LLKCPPVDTLVKRSSYPGATFRTRGRLATRCHPQDCYLACVLKLLLMSVLFATFVLPAVAASGKRPVNSLRSMLISILLAELAYAFFLRFLYSRFV